MVNLTLSNVNQDSSCKQVVINLITGMCVVENGLEIESRLLADTMNFNHPLLTHAMLELSDDGYVYEYDDFDGLLDAVKCIYATLIQVSDPLNCKFKIKPSSNFVRLKDQYNLFFSMDHKKPATEQIGIQQLNLLISRFSGYDFSYQDTLVLDLLITVNDLPSEINGDLICKTNMDMMHFCKQADDVRQYELRYINRFIGFGVFARENIAKGEWITWYCGVKNYANDKSGLYVFGQENDALNLRIDAMHHGNISRFINHAPQDIRSVDHKPSSNVLEANIITKRHHLYGNNIVLYTAKRTIHKGEQLLMDYGANYVFLGNSPLFIQDNGNVIGLNNKVMKESRNDKRQTLRLMSQQGIKRAQWLLIRKPLIVLTVALFLGSILTLTRYTIL